jgi:hypothetical protein
MESGFGHRDPNLRFFRVVERNTRFDQRFSSPGEELERNGTVGVTSEQVEPLPVPDQDRRSENPFKRYREVRQAWSRVYFPGLPEEILDHEQQSISSLWLSSPFCKVEE